LMLGYACVPNEQIGPAFNTLARVIERSIDVSRHASAAARRKTS
jgi:GntR family transcriptional regulator / MocR family aminotransferase